MRHFWMFPLLLVSTFAMAGDWPQFQGPQRDGLSPEKGLAASWPKEGPKELWTFDLNPGYGGAAVQGGKVYIMDRIGDDKDVVYCLDLATGKKLWDCSYDAPGKVDHPGSRSTPALDDKHVYTMGPMGDLYCIDLETHSPVWHANILKDFNGKPARWAVTQSPALYKDWVIVAPQGGKAGVAALEKLTGKVAWTSDPIGPPSYVSPLVTTIDKVTQVVMTSAKKTVGVDIETGKILWTYDGWSSRNPIPTATPIGDGRLFLTSTATYKSDCAMFRPQLKDGKWTVEQLFKNDDCQSQMHNALLYEKHLYAGSAANRKGLICMDLDGNVLWDSKGGYDNGSNLVIADGMIYIMDGAKGVLHLVKATPDSYQELAKAPVLRRGPVWATMAIADGKLLCRDQKQLKCLDIAK